MADVGDFLLENDRDPGRHPRPEDSPGPGVFGGSWSTSTSAAPIRASRARRATTASPRCSRSPTCSCPIRAPPRSPCSTTAPTGKRRSIRVEGEGAFLFEALGILRDPGGPARPPLPRLKTAFRFRTDYILRPGERHVTIRRRCCCPTSGRVPERRLVRRSSARTASAGDDGCPACACGEPLSLDNYAGPSDVFGGIFGDSQNRAPERNARHGGRRLRLLRQPERHLRRPAWASTRRRRCTTPSIAGRNTFQQPLSFDFVAAAGGDVSYGYFTVPKAPEGRPASTVNVPHLHQRGDGLPAAGKSCLSTAPTTPTATASAPSPTSATSPWATATSQRRRRGVEDPGDADGRDRGRRAVAATGEPAPERARLRLPRPRSRAQTWRSVDELAEAELRAPAATSGLHQTPSTPTSGLDPVRGRRLPRRAPARRLRGRGAEPTMAWAVSGPTHDHQAPEATVSVAATLP